MPELKLDLSFKRADGGNAKISIEDAKPDITEAQANSLMDLIIANNIFTPNGSSLTAKSKIELISTDVVEFNVV